MPRVIKITVRDKLATADASVYVCGNSDYIVHFDFDDEWGEYIAKTARFVYGSRYIDVVFNGNECPVPIISNAYGLNVGVFAGNLHTTTPAYVQTERSILCGAGAPEEPVPDVYHQIIELVNEACVASDEAVKQSGESAVDAAEHADRAAESEKEAEGHRDAVVSSATFADQSAKSAAKSAADASIAADRAEMAVDKSGWFDVEVDDTGHLIYTRSSTVDNIDFEMQEGRLLVNYG